MTSATGFVVAKPDGELRIGNHIVTITSMSSMQNRYPMRQQRRCKCLNAISLEAQLSRNLNARNIVSAPAVTTSDRES